MENYAIWIIKEILTDGSEVFAIELSGEKFDCVTETKAMNMAEKIRDAIVENTNIEVGIFESY